VKKLSVLFAVSLSTVFVSQVLAQPAMLRDNILTIPQAASLDGDSPVYYANVQLNANAMAVSPWLGANSRTWWR
jgi:ACT domain-containing protein